MDRNVLQRTEAVFEKDYVITDAQADSAGNVTFAALAGMMQDLTTVHMNHAGISVDSLMEKNLLWVIVFTQINISRLPKAGETVEQYSWAGAEKFGMHARRYGFFSKDGEELLNAASLFLLVDKDSRSLSEPAKETIALPIVAVEGEPRLPKITQKAPALLFGKQHEVKEKEIDYNGHVNNAVYLDWADGIFDPEFVKRRRMKGVWVQYEKEILLGQNVEMKYGGSDEFAFLIGCVKGEECFKVKFEF